MVSIPLRKMLGEEHSMGIKKHLTKIYGEAIADIYIDDYEAIIHSVKNNGGRQKKALDEKDVVLITYADQFYEPDEKNIQTFRKFADAYLKGIFEIIHFLPFYPYSSDDGFSVIDYLQVKKEIGDWQDFEGISQDFNLMYDFVCNHISSKSAWFKEFLEGNPDYKDYFIESNQSEDLSLVTRPRTTPLLTHFETAESYKDIWTTFGPDQIDLNYGHPKVLLKMLEIFLMYTQKGASWIRLDAVGYIWKEIGTNCIHHPKAHEIVKLFRTALDQTSSGFKIITETNVPHADNISYFGNGKDESHMVYQFPLPPLVLYSFLNQDATMISKWAKSVTLPSEETSFFNFLASHDGVGINPIRGIIPEEEILALVDRLQKEAGALVSYKDNADGSKSPYEINVSYFSAIKCQSSDDEAITKFINAQSILLGLIGVPAIYIHSLLGSQNYTEGIFQTKQNRTINRQKYQLQPLLALLEDPTSIHSRVYNALVALIKIRKQVSAFSPKAHQEILELDDSVFAFLRISETNERVMCLHNFSDKKITLHHEDFNRFHDLLDDNKEIVTNGTIDLLPYMFKWISI